MNKNTSDFLYTLTTVLGAIAIFFSILFSGKYLYENMIIKKQMSPSNIEDIENVYMDFDTGAIYLKDSDSVQGILLGYDKTSEYYVIISLDKSVRRIDIDNQYALKLEPVDRLDGQPAVLVNESVMEQLMNSDTVRIGGNAYQSTEVLSLATEVVIKTVNVIINR